MKSIRSPHPLSDHAFILRACRASFDWDTTAYFSPEIMRDTGVPTAKQAFEHSVAKKILRERELESLRQMGVPENSLIEPLSDEMEQGVRRRVDGMMHLIRMCVVDICSSLTTAMEKKVDTLIAQAAIAGVAHSIWASFPAGTSKRKRYLATCDILNRGIPAKDRAEQLQGHHVRSAIDAIARKRSKCLAPDPLMPPDQFDIYFLEPSAHAMALLDVSKQVASEFQHLQGLALAEAIEARGILGTMMFEHRAERLSHQNVFPIPQIGRFKSAVL